MRDKGDNGTKSYKIDSLFKKDLKITLKITIVYNGTNQSTHIASH